MRRFRSLPIRSKITVTNLATCGVALVAALAAVFGFEIYKAGQVTARDLAALTAVVAENVRGFVDFGDKAGSERMLQVLQARPEIVAARLLDGSGAELARYGAGGRFVAPPAGAPYLRQGFRIYLARGVVSGGDAIGVLQVTADLRPALAALSTRMAATAAVAVAGALLVGLLVAARLSRRISGPLTALTATAREVAARDDYTLRAAKASDDEIGELTDAFNHMLSEVQGRDLQLSEAHRELSEQFKTLERESSELLRAQEERRALERRMEQTQRLESLGVLAGGIAHDFNNILTGILGGASLARMDVEPGSELDKRLERIEASSRRAAELCEQMLAYAGKARAGARVLDLNKLSRETVELIHASIPQDAELALELDPALPAVLGDAARIRQVLMNLLMNAAEALALQPRRIGLSTRRVGLDAAEIGRMTFPGVATPGEFAQVEVSDTGVGIAPDNIRRIFEPFYTSKFTGRGLGLSAVLGIIKSSGGALDLQSSPGRGTIFRVHFPACAEPAAADPERNGAGPVPAQAAAGGRVLVVDDEAAVRDIVTAALRRMKFEVVAVGDGRTAVDWLRSHPGPFAGAFLDLTMPGMDGVATLRALREIDPGLKAILMSGYDEQDTLGKFGNLEVAAFLQKPFSVDALRERAKVLSPA